MTNQIILQKAVEKAVKNGYQFDTLYWTKSMLKEGVSEHIIFSHDFAKAFVRYILDDNHSTLLLFGDSDLIQKCRKARILEKSAKELFLTEMVLEKDPLQYLEKFL